MAGMNILTKHVNSERKIELNSALGEYVYVVTEHKSYVLTAKTNAERQRDYRARKASQHTTEVRGMFAHSDDHSELRAHAAKIAKKRVILAKKLLASGVI